VFYGVEGVLAAKAVVDNVYGIVIFSYQRGVLENWSARRDGGGAINSNAATRFTVERNANAIHCARISDSVVTVVIADIALCQIPAVDEVIAFPGRNLVVAFAAVEKVVAITADNFICAIKRYHQIA
jgi:hypothetical protein